MTVFLLQLTAMVTMLIDHIEVVFAIDPSLRLIGRIAFPLYTFLIVNGYYHVRRKEGGLRQYLLRLLLLAVVSEFAYDLMSEGKLVDWNEQNQVLQFFIAMAALGAAGWLKEHTSTKAKASPEAGISKKEAGPTSPGTNGYLAEGWSPSTMAKSSLPELSGLSENNLSSSKTNPAKISGAASFIWPPYISGALCVAVWVAAMAVCHRFHIGYSGSGILLIIIYKIYFDRFYDKDIITRLLYLVVMTLFFVAVEWVEVYYNAGVDASSFISNIKFYFRWYKRNTWASFGMPLAAAYQGEMGYNGKGFRIFYRFFYPVHQFVLWGLSLIL